MPYKPFIHVIKLDKPEVQGILNGHCYITAKLDGTNAVVYYDTKNNLVCGGSRKRAIDLIHDNAGFASWLNTTAEEPLALQTFLRDNPDIIVYGEWGVGRVGHIKDYDEGTADQLWIFDAFSIGKNEYLHDMEWRELLAQYGLNKWFIPILAEIDNPTLEQIIEVAQKNYFRLNYTTHPGEGVVIRNHEYKDAWGNYQVGKLVLQEYLEMKKKPKARPQFDNIEQSIVDTYLSNAFLSKNIAKVATACGVDKFDKTSGKMIGMFLNLTYTDLLEENILDILKKYKSPTIKFGELDHLCKQRCREYLGF